MAPGQSIVGRKSSRSAIHRRITDISHSSSTCRHLTLGLVPSGSSNAIGLKLKAVDSKAATFQHQWSDVHLPSGYKAWQHVATNASCLVTSGAPLRAGSVVHAAYELLAGQDHPNKRIAVFVSGGGSNFKAIHAACLDGRIRGDIVVVLSDKPTCGGVQYAQQHGIPTLIFPNPKNGDFAGLSTEELMEALVHTHKADLVVLAGFLKLVPAELVRAFKCRILNIHPALLPSFGGKGYYGIRVHQAVVAAGVRVTGPTVHFVDEEYDKGPILAQTAVPVYPTDTPQEVAARVLQQEHVIYPMAIAAICDERVSWRPDGVPIIWNSQ